MQEFLNLLSSYSIAQNELWRVLLLFGALLAGLVVGRVLRHWLEQIAAVQREREHPLLAIVLETMAKPMVMIAFVLGLRVGVSALVLNPVLQGWSEAIINVLIVLSVGFVAYRAVDVVTFWLKRMAERSGSKLDEMLVPMVRASLRVTISILVLLQVATVLSDKPLTSILAGLGVGGVALALAAQDTIKNFFGSLVIFADKPFELGDRIVVDGCDGSVEEVGFRSTRVRTLEGHLVTIPNGELANKTIQNITKRPNIRRIMNITVTYDTPPEKVQEAVDIVKELLQDHEGMDPEMPPRVVFNELNATSLNIFAIYWYHPPDWWMFQAFNEKVMFELLRRFNAAGIQFAFPTQTVHLAGADQYPLNLVMAGPDRVAGGAP
jgi:MscS family membrane protein